MLVFSVFHFIALTLKLQNLSLEQTEELQDDIEKYLSLEQVDLHIDFWTVSKVTISLKCTIRSPSL